MGKEFLIKTQKKYFIFRQETKKLSAVIEKMVRKEKNWKISLDFSGAIFLSRSFIDELLNIINDYKKRRIIIEPVNLGSELKKLFEGVKKRKENIRKQNR